jgi:hypothetical protein
VLRLFGQPVAREMTGENNGIMERL